MYSPLHFFYFFQKKIDENSFVQNQYLLQFAIVLSITHKVNIHLQPNFRRLIFKISYEIYLSACKIIN